MIARIALVAILAAAAGCATGPKYSEVKDSIPELDPIQGRIYFYRPGSFGALVRPNILLNGVVVGEMAPQGFFFVDRLPGNYTATATTETQATVHIPLEANQTRFVKGNISMGIVAGRPSLVLVDREDAMIEIVDLAYTGSATLSAGAAGAPSVSAAPAAPPPTHGATKLKDLEGLLQEKAK